MKFNPLKVIGVIFTFAGVVVSLQPTSCAMFGGMLLLAMSAIIFVLDYATLIEKRVKKLEEEDCR